MTPPPTITSRQNPRIVAARRLSERKQRQQQGRFLVEGVKLLTMALRAGAQPREAFVCHEQLGPSAASMLDSLLAAGAELLSVSPSVMQALAEREAAEGLVVTFDLFAASLAALRLRGDDLVLVLDRLQDPGNLGTLLRTADAVGAAGVVLLEPCVDPFDPKVVRGSMGSLFNLPLVRSGDVDGLFTACAAAACASSPPTRIRAWTGARGCGRTAWRWCWATRRAASRPTSSRTSMPGRGCPSPARPSRSTSPWPAGC